MLSRASVGRVSIFSIYIAFVYGARPRTKGGGGKIPRQTGGGVKEGTGGKNGAGKLGEVAVNLTGGGKYARID